MPSLYFSRGARADLLSIGEYTLQSWGPAQAEHYLAGLEQCAKLLACNPLLGRARGCIRPGLRRFEKGRHVVFYRRHEDGILTSRILRQGMLPDQQEFDDPNGDS